MKRENRYLVLKYTDIEKYLSDDEKALLMSIDSGLSFARQQEDRGILKAVVVESDWPEYEPTWKAIEQRVEEENKPHHLDVELHKAGMLDH